ncbi:MAG: LysR family transcriptional regulator [Cellvibrionaceae bacterium]|nr:LysR family transcriptional regulator [Cellvibrionaceae bacterium]
MKNLPIDVLRAFVAISQLGGFTQAGEQLGRSQPAISLQIKRLEDLVGKALFVRNGPNVGLTEHGRTLLGYAEKILSLNDEAFSKIDNALISGKVRLGIPSEFATTLLPKIVSRFVRAHPNVTLDVHCDLSKNLFTKSGQRNHDLILALHDKHNQAGHQYVKTDEMVWVASQTYKVDLQTSISLIAAPNGCIYRKRAVARLEQSNRPWQIIYTNPDLSGIQAAIEEGLGITVLARSTVPGTLKILKPSAHLPRLGKMGISLVKTHKNNNRAVDKMAEYLTSSLG